MLQKDNRYKVMETFFDDPNPSGGFKLREISRKVRIAPISVKKYLNELAKEGIIVKFETREGYPVYYADLSSEDYRFYKKLDIIRKIHESELPQYLLSVCGSRVIILFGSASLGEEVSSSDLDLFLLCKYKKLDLTKYENYIKRKINILFEENFNKLSKELRNNLINGIILQGYIKVF